MLLASYAYEGRLDAHARGLSLALLPSIALGMLSGELAFRRLPTAGFRTMVFVMLLASGVALVVRG
jgi:uncharacterized membrane protein YfcA